MSFLHLDRLRFSGTLMICQPTRFYRLSQRCVRWLRNL